MTPQQLSASECCNNRSGVCTGAFFKDIQRGSGARLEIVMATDRAGKPCCVATERCRFFEECVLPMANLQTQERKSREYLEAAQSYKTQFDRQEVYGKRLCRCGGLLPARKKLCLKCAKESRRESYRKANSGRRAINAICLTTVKPENI